MMKLNKWICFGMGLLGVGFMGCEEQQPGRFNEINGIYFNNRLRNNTLVDSTSLTFVYERADTLDVPVVIQLLGRPSETARPLGIRVSSEDAVEGVDYVLKTVAEMPANTTSVNYIVMLKKTPVLKQESRSIILELYANDYFDLPLPYLVQAGADTTSILQYRIIFSDHFTVAPEGWREDYGGAFSQQKFELICRYFDMDPGLFVKRNDIPFSQWVYMNYEITLYVKEQVKKKEAGESYDEEAFDKETGEPLKFTTD